MLKAVSDCIFLSLDRKLRLVARIGGEGGCRRHNRAPAVIDFLVDHSGWTFDELKEKPYDID